MTDSSPDDSKFQYTSMSFGGVYNNKDLNMIWHENRDSSSSRAPG